MRRQAVFRAVWCWLAMVLAGASIATAQVPISGSISGTVTDNAGGVIPGATVQLKDEDEGTGTQKHKKCIVKMGGSVV
jgi:hypothetical protein